MPRTNFGPEVKAAMQGGNKPPMKQIAEREPQDIAKQEQLMARDSSGNPDKPPKAPGPGRGGMPGMPHPSMPRQPAQMMPGGGGGGAPGLPHVAAAASIAHAILGNRGMQ